MEDDKSLREHVLYESKGVFTLKYQNVLIRISTYQVFDEREEVSKKETSVE